jgi:uncharacterized protein YheU (UPF0270 family)
LVGEVPAFINREGGDQGEEEIGMDLINSSSPHHSPLSL